MARRVWIEVALNGGAGRRAQPLIPITADEIIAEGIACANAGAAILHVHAYDPATGRQDDNWETYARIVEAIRAEVDVIVYPTVPISLPAGWKSRYDAVEKLAERGLLDWTVVDPGSVNLLPGELSRARGTGTVYENNLEDLRHGMAIAARAAAPPTYAIYEPGFVRLGAALARETPDAPPPVYRLMFSDYLLFGFPPAEWALRAYVEHLKGEAPGAPWMIAGLTVDVVPLMPLAVSLGGHVRIGLEDAPLGSELTNTAWLDRCLETLAAADGEPATPEEVRAAFRVHAARA